MVIATLTGGCAFELQADRKEKALTLLQRQNR